MEFNSYLDVSNFNNMTHFLLNLWKKYVKLNEDLYGDLWKHGINPNL